MYFVYLSPNSLIIFRFMRCCFRTGKMGFDRSETAADKLADELFKKGDVNGDGGITVAEFRSTIGQSIIAPAWAMLQSV